MMYIFRVIFFTYVFYFIFFLGFSNTRFHFIYFTSRRFKHVVDAADSSGSLFVQNEIHKCITYKCVYVCVYAFTRTERLNQSYGFCIIRKLVFRTKQIFR